VAAVRPDLETIGVHPAALVAEFAVLLKKALERLGFEPLQIRHLLAATLANLP
jgi:hypothetical protein